MTKVRESPNVFTVDDFLTSNEITHLGKLIANQKLSRSFTGAGILLPEWVAERLLQMAMPRLVLSQLSALPGTSG